MVKNNCNRKVKFIVEKSKYLYLTALILASEIFTYSASRSIPIQFLFRFLQAIAVVPLPRNGSSTVCPSLLTNFTRYSIRAIGLTVGWLFLVSFNCGLSSPFLLSLPPYSHLYLFHLLPILNSSLLQYSHLMVFLLL